MSQNVDSTGTQTHKFKRLNEQTSSQEMKFFRQAMRESFPEIAKEIFRGSESEAVPAANVSNSFISIVLQPIPF